MNTTSQLSSTDYHQQVPANQGSSILCVRCTNSAAVSTRLVARTKLTTSTGCHQAAAAGGTKQQLAPGATCRQNSGESAPLLC